MATIHNTTTNDLMGGGPISVAPQAPLFREFEKKWEKKVEKVAGKEGIVADLQRWMLKTDRNLYASLTGQKEKVAPTDKKMEAIALAAKAKQGR